MQLIGSNASPFVRRIRILLDQKDCEFIALIYSMMRRTCF